MSISNFSISQNPTVVFLKKLNSELDELMIQQNSAIELEEDERKKQELRIQLMYDIERLRMEKMKEFLNISQNLSQKHESSILNSGQTSKSNFSNTVLSQRKKKLMRLNSKDTKNMKKKSLFVGRPDLGLRFDVKKRNSHQIDIGSNTLSAFSFNKDILENQDELGIADKIFESIKNNSFKLEKLKEEKAEDVDSSDISDEPFSPKERYNQVFLEDDACSVESRELEPEQEVEEEDMELLNDELKEVVLLSLIKERNVLYGFNSKNSNINVLGYFKSGSDNNFNHNHRRLPFEESDFNYVYLIAENKFMHEKIYHGSSGDTLLQNSEQGSKISDFEPPLISKVQICEFEEKSNNEESNQFNDVNHTVKIINHPVAYSVHLDNSNSKFLTTYCIHDNHQTSLPNYPNKLDLTFNANLKTHFMANVTEGCYSSFMNLDQDKFRDRLLLEEGSFFMINEKRGFYVSLISTGKENNKLLSFVKKHLSPDKIEFCAVNFDYSKAYQFYCRLMGFNVEEGDGILKEAEMDQFRAKYQSFCYDYINKHDTPALCFNIVEYMFDYRIYRTVRKCILFQVNDNQTEFFTKPLDDNFNIKFGVNFHKMMKTLKLHNLNSITAFNFPYDVTVGYKYELQKFYMQYSNWTEHPSEYVRFQDEKIDRCVNFKVDEKEEVNEFKEGIWISLAQYVEFADNFTSEDRQVALPYGSLLMFYKNVFRVTKKSMQIMYN